MTVRGIFGRANEFNNNNRKYPKSVLEREVVKLQPLINENRLLGELDHPEKMSVSLMNASHLVTKLAWQGDVLIGEAKILNTPSGKVAQQLIKDGVKIGVSSRGLGTLKECKEFPGKFEVNEDYRAVTFDLVADPSTKGAFPGLVNESTQILLEKTKKEVAAQSLLLKLFEDKISQARANSVRKLFEGEQRAKRLINSKNGWVKGYQAKDVIRTKKALKGKVVVASTTPILKDSNKRYDDYGTFKTKGFKEWVKRGHRKAYDPRKQYPVKESVIQTLIESALKESTYGDKRLKRIDKLKAKNGDYNSKRTKSETQVRKLRSDSFRKGSNNLTKQALKGNKPDLTGTFGKKYREFVGRGHRKHYGLDFMQGVAKAVKDKERK
jgi:hypothetical protein